MRCNSFRQDRPMIQQLEEYPEMFSNAQNLMDKLIDADSKDKDTLALITYIAAEDKLEKILENQHILRMPIVRNGKKATVGYQPDVWKDWD